MTRVSAVWFLCVLIGLGCLSLGFAALTPSAYAQQSEPWTFPVQASQGLVDEAGLPLRSAFPVLVSGASGGIHAFWTLVPRDEDQTKDGMVFYSYWDGSAWTTPVDVLFWPGRPMWLPQAARSPDDRLYVVWTDGTQGPVWYSSAPASLASSAKSWSVPVQLSDVHASGEAVATDSAGHVYVAYATGQDDDRVFSLSSDDGVSWSDPALIYSPCDDCSVRLATDARGRVHAVFGSQATDGQAVYYSRSDDYGNTWLPAVELDHVDSRYAAGYGPAHVNVATIGADEVHIVWDGSPAGQRWHQMSRDGGQTWSSPEQISPDHRGLTLPVAMAVDSAGTLHLVSMGWRDIPGKPSGAFHFSWKDGRWSSPQLIGPRTDWDAEYAALAISDGNVLHAAWTEKQNGGADLQIWMSSLQTDALAERLQPKPTTMPPAATVSPTAETGGGQQVEKATEPAGGSGEQPAAGVAVASPSPPQVDSGQDGAAPVGDLGVSSSSSTWWPIFAGVLPVLLFLVVTFIVRLSSHGRR